MTRKRRCNVGGSEQKLDKAGRLLKQAEEVLIENLTKITLVMDAIRVALYQQLDLTFVPIGNAANSIREQIRNRLKETEDTLRQIQQSLQINLSRQILVQTERVERITNQVARLQTPGVAHGFPQTLQEVSSRPSGTPQGTPQAAEETDNGASDRANERSDRAYADAQSNDLLLRQMPPLAVALDARDSSVQLESQSGIGEQTRIDESDLQTLSAIESGFSVQPSDDRLGGGEIPDDLGLAIPYLYLLRKGMPHEKALLGTAAIVFDPKGKVASDLSLGDLSNGTHGTPGEGPKPDWRSNLAESSDIDRTNPAIPLDTNPPIRVE